MLGKPNVQPPKVVIVGGVAWNTMVHLNEWFASGQGSGAAKRWFQALGSTGAGKALNMRQLGFDVYLHSLLGADAAAEAIQSELENRRIRCDWHRYDGPSERHLNLMSPGGERRSVFLEQEPDLDIAISDKLIRAWDEADYHWINIKPYCRRWLNLLKASGKPIWCDLHDYDEGNPFHAPFIEAADYLMLSAEALSQPERFMADQIAAGKRLVVITDGAGDIRAMDHQGNRYRVTPPCCDELIDSNGAGDAFSAGLLYGWHHHYSVEEALQLGACAGVICLASERLSNPEMDEEQLMTVWQRHYR